MPQDESADSATAAASEGVAAATGVGQGGAAGAGAAGLSPQMQIWLQEAQSSGIDTSSLELLQAMQNLSTSLQNTNNTNPEADDQKIEHSAEVGAEDTNALASLYDVTALKELMSDPGRFQEVCCQHFHAAAEAVAGDPTDGSEESIEDEKAGGPRLLRSPEEYRWAISQICTQCGMEEMDSEDAEDLFVDNMSVEEFRQSTKAYFDGLISVLDMQGDFLAGF